MLEVQGTKCKKFSLSPHVNKTAKSGAKKKSVQIALFFEDQKASCVIGKQRIKTSPKIQFHSNIVNQIPVSRMHNDIVLSSDLPSVPYYMPKLFSRTPSPLRGTRSKFTKLRMNLYSSGHEPIVQVFEANKKKYDSKIIKAMNKSLNLETLNIVKTRNINTALKRFRLMDLELQLPSIASLRKSHKKTTHA